MNILVYVRSDVSKRFEASEIILESAARPQSSVLTLTSGNINFQPAYTLHQYKRAKKSHRRAPSIQINPKVRRQPAKLLADPRVNGQHEVVPRVQEIQDPLCVDCAAKLYTKNVLKLFFSSAGIVKSAWRAEKGKGLVS